MNGAANPIGLLIALAVLSALFALVEWRFRSVDAPPFYARRDFRTDLAYWFFTPLVSRAFTRVAVGLAVAALVWAAGGSLAELRAGVAAGRPIALGWELGRAKLAALPFAAQLLLGLALADLISYWMHRAFHARPLWGLHAVHHSSPRLDWLSSVRLHPLNQAAMSVAQSLPLLFVGFDPRVFAVVAPALTLYAIVLHANVGWDLGPLRRVVASPRFHRWHHASQAEGRDKNFAGLLPLWDLLFGTYHMPADRAPRAFGAGDEPVPAGIWRQLAYPFRKPRAGEPLAHERV
ncbi:MAG TPA: sterol desaturase family protein [Myxococcota bacterium]|nr:sterol desaturase family protein [Myxococcota bacterium]